MSIMASYLKLVLSKSICFPPWQRLGENLWRRGGEEEEEEKDDGY